MECWSIGLFDQIESSFRIFPLLHYPNTPLLQLFKEVL